VTAGICQSQSNGAWAMYTTTAATGPAASAGAPRSARAAASATPARNAASNASPTTPSSAAVCNGNEWASLAASNTVR
jgi:hypothetical protein